MPQRCVHWDVLLGFPTMRCACWGVFLLLFHHHFLPLHHWQLRWCHSLLLPALPFWSFPLCLLCGFSASTWLFGFCGPWGSAFLTIFPLGSAFCSRARALMACSVFCVLITHFFMSVEHRRFLPPSDPHMSWLLLYILDLSITWRMSHTRSFLLSHPLLYCWGSSPCWVSRHDSVFKLHQDIY